MTYTAFRTAVLDNLTTDGTRLGVETFRDNLIQAAARDIQSHVSRYQVGNEKILYPADFTDDGEASLGELEAGALVTEMLLYRTTAGTVVSPNDPEDAADVVIFPVRLDFDWSNRRELVTEQVNLHDQNAIAAISPDLTEFIVFPAIKLSVDVNDDGILYDHFIKYTWNGIASDWEGSDETPFDTSVALAASWYVKAMLTMSRNEKEGQTFMELYRMALRKLFLNQSVG